MTYYPGRLCIPFGIQCNLHCKYCYRDICRKGIPTNVTSNFLDYISSAPKRTYAIIASGGEPLCNWEEVVKVFDHAPSHMHKKIMTNGSLLNKEIIDYINDNDIEVHLSYDGNMSKYLRGYDVLDDKLALVRKIHNLRILSVITNRNTDVLQVYREIKGKLQRPFYFSHSVIVDSPTNQSLIDGFDYDTYERSLCELLVSEDKLPTTWYHNKKPSRLGFNYLLDGSVVGIHTLNRYGSVWDDEETLLNNFYKIENIYKCLNKTCYIRDICGQDFANASDHMCRIEKIRQNVFAMLNNGGVGQYVRT